MHRVDDLHVAGAAAVVPAEPLEHLVAVDAPPLRSISAVAAITMPGVQKPHWAA